MTGTRSPDVNVVPDFELVLVFDDVGDILDLMASPINWSLGVFPCLQLSTIETGAQGLDVKLRTKS